MLLVLNLVVPTLQADESLAEALGDLSSQVLAWILSFVVIAVLWFSHHETIADLLGADWMVVAVNFGFLALVSVLPFTTDLLGTYGGEAVATALYAGNIAVVILALVLLPRVARWRGLRADDGSPIGDFELFATTACFAVSIPIAYANPTLAKVVWAFSLLGSPAERLVRRRR